MKPNELGGKTWENGVEIKATFSAMLADGYVEDVIRLQTLVDTSDASVAILHPYYMSVRAIGTLSLGPEDTALAMSSLRKAAWGELEVSRYDRAMARSLVRCHYEDSRRGRVAKVLSSIFKP